MVEAMANGVEDRLIDGLSFKLAPGASYITDRRSVTFHPQGSNIYTPTAGTKLIRLLLTGDSWLDPSTFRIMFDVVNNDSAADHNLRPLAAPWAFFRRLRILAGGQVVEDIDYYNRIHQMLHTLIAKESIGNDCAEAFGYTIDDLKQVTLATDVSGIPPNGGSQTVLFKPLSGLLGQDKYLPIRYCPLTIELELVDDVNDPVVSGSVNGTGVITATVNQPFTAATTSTTWAIQQVQVKVDMCTLDNALDNSYAQHLLSGKALPINYNTWVSQFQAISGSDVQLNVTRALTRLKSVFVTLDKDFTAGSYRDIFHRKKRNDLFSPMSF